DLGQQGDHRGADVLGVDGLVGLPVGAGVVDLEVVIEVERSLGETSETHRFIVPWQAVAAGLRGDSPQRETDSSRSRSRSTLSASQPSGATIASQAVNGS